MPLWRVDEEFRIEGHPAARLDIELNHPSVEAALVELGVDRPIERIGEIDPAAIPAGLDHLRAATEPSILRPLMGCARDNAANPHFACELGIEWIGHIVLLQIAGAPARDIEELVVHREVDVGYERRASF